MDDLDQPFAKRSKQGEKESANRKRQASAYPIDLVAGVIHDLPDLVFNVGLSSLPQQ